MDNYVLFEQLLRAESEGEVDEILEHAGLLNDDKDLWRPFGDVEMNLSTINNQQSDPTAALVEKLINAIDAVLISECFKAGLNPGGDEAPHTMAEAVEKFLGVKDGRLENLSATERTALADNIHLVATGTKKNPSYLIIDRGEGQSPSSFWRTFLSLNQRNKDDIPFVQGRFNCGGTGVLPFCGQRNYQFIASRRNPSCPVESGDKTKDLWGFTIVRRLPPAHGRKSSMYVYLAPKKEILTFPAPDGIRVLPGPSSKGNPAEAYAVKLQHGSCIKLYDYRWKKRTLLTTDGRYELERFLHSVCLPFRLSETRDYRANYYSTTLSGIMSTHNDEGNEEGDLRSKFESDFNPAYGELNLQRAGRLPYRIYLLKEEHKRYSREFPHGVFFTLNGQVHGELPANFVSNALKFDLLSGYLMVSVECTYMSPDVREALMMASRDRIRRNEVYDEIHEALQSELKEHPGLRQHNAVRRKKLLEETLSDQNKATDYFNQLMKSDPTLASVLGIGSHVISTTGPVSNPEPYMGKKFPTFFRLVKEPKEGLVKACSLNRFVRVEFETDAANDYFERVDCPGSVIFEPPNLCISSHLWNGKFATKFQMPYDANTGDVLRIKVTVSDIERDAVGQPFVSEFTMRGEPEKEDAQPAPPGKQPSGKKWDANGKRTAPSLAMPNIQEVRREQWDEPFFEFNEFSAVKISDSTDGNGYDFYVNVDNRYLINELHRAKEADKSLIKHWFVYGIVLAGMGLLGEFQRYEQEANSDGNENEADERDYLKSVAKACAGIARVIVPIIRSLSKA